MTVEIIKLMSGEEIIGDVINISNSSTVTIKKPCVLQMVPSRNNPEQPMMALFPYAAYTENHSISVDKAHVLWSERPIKELYNQYNSVFGTGIQLAGV